RRSPEDRSGLNMNSTVAVVGLIVGAASGLASLALLLWFLWRVYDRGGRTDLVAAAKALRQVYDPSWAAKLSRFLPSSSSPEDAGDPRNPDDEPGSDRGPPENTPPPPLP